MTQPGSRAASQGRLPRDLPFVLAAALGFSVSSIHFYSFGLFMQPLEQTFGWSRSEISAALMLTSVVGVTMAPLIGYMVDRWGSRRIGLPGIVAYCAAFTLMGVTGPSIWSFWAHFVLLAMALSFITATVWSAAVAARFGVGQRGFAMALALCGSSVGMFLAPTASEYLIAHHGWRIGYAGLAAIFAGLSLPMIYVFFHDSDAPQENPGPDAAIAAWRGPDIHWREALKTVRFWFITIVSLVASVSLLALVTHFVPMATEAGIDRATAAGAVSLLGFSSVAGRLLEGWLLDRFKGPAIGALSLLLPSCACLLILFGTPSTAWAIAIALLLGAAVGAEVNIMAYLTARYFGVRSYGVLFGIVYGMVILGGGAGPLMSAMIRDRTGSYDAVAWTVLLLCLLSAALILMLGPYPEQRDGDESAA